MDEIAAENIRSTPNSSIVVFLPLLLLFSSSFRFFHCFFCHICVDCTPNHLSFTHSDTNAYYHWGRSIHGLFCGCFKHLLHIVSICAVCGCLYLCMWIVLHVFLCMFVGWSWTLRHAAAVRWATSMSNSSKIVHTGNRLGDVPYNWAHECCRKYYPRRTIEKKRDPQFCNSISSIMYDNKWMGGFVHVIKRRAVLFFFYSSSLSVVRQFYVHINCALFGTSGYRIYC